MHDVTCDGNVHAIPDNDIFEHVEHSDCLCAPTLQLILADPRDKLSDDVYFYYHHGLNGNLWRDLPD